MLGIVKSNMPHGTTQLVKWHVWTMEKLELAVGVLKHAAVSPRKGWFADQLMTLYPIVSILLMEEIPNNHLGCIKPCR